VTKRGLFVALDFSVSVRLCMLAACLQCSLILIWTVVSSL